MSSPLLEVLLLAWGICFIARYADATPNQKARNFTKAIKKGLQRDSDPVAMEGPSRQSSVASREQSNGGQHPNRDVAQGRSSGAGGSGIGDSVSADAFLV